ncbi:hypothetical protein NIES4072_42850 [Nostoc commune NIES-4072]|uniref:DUF1902 domain-containing protein n=1 Tax=Nostoc commune NIES-4072 TaxID=2005467 RepID=A0A2R5FY63_NOSCO|nr:hypothetical protein NIES4070_47980 [Nostoc commune HK-02]GBG20604.1 hypothetical protein NIES4072_42850 [Nostoc commune NIES-4072]
MTQNTLKVHAFWDKDAEVWVATSENVPGLVTEASTIESLTQNLREMIPELLILNQIVPYDYVGSISFELTSHVLRSSNKVALVTLRLLAVVYTLIIKSAVAQQQVMASQLSPWFWLKLRSIF